MDNLKIAVMQMTALNDFQYNTNLILKILNEQLTQKVDIVFLPENCIYLRLDKKTLPPFLEIDSEVFDPLKLWAKENETALHLGGVGVSLQGKSYNASLFVDTHGVLSHTYSKQSLFDIDLPNGHSYRESDAYAKGSKNSLLQFKDWRMGQSICFDLRFSAIYEDYARDGVDAILVPSSFLVPTGKAHWHCLNRARAIETQSYVISAAQVGDHAGKHQSFGHSVVFDPWGECLLDLKEESNILGIVEISKEKIKAVRTQMPMNRTKV